MKTPIISIIVPVYKVENYIRRCLNSIIAQTFTNWECILIDDGSPDNSGKICDEYAENDERFMVIHQENKGVSAARNAGLDCAKGEWIVFVDSDDYIADGALSDIECNIKKSNANLLILEYVCAGKKQRSISWEKIPVNKDMKTEDFYSFGRIPGTCWGMMIRKRVLDNNCITFANGVLYCEDTMFFMECLANSKIVRWTNIVFNIVVSRDDSATKIYNERRMDSYVQTLNAANYLRNKYQKSISFKKMLMQHNLYLCIANTIISSIKYGYNYKEIIQKYNIQQYLPLEIYSHSHLKSRMRIINISCKLYYLVMKLMYK